MAEPSHTHPHLGGQAEAPHSHAYLLEIFQAQPAAAAPPFVSPAALLLALLAVSAAWWALAGPAITPGGWQPRQASPPPRARLVLAG
jgi:hypothetical protein